MMAFANTPRSWNTHALLTRAALKSVSEPRLSENVEVVGIGEFISQAERDFVAIIEEYGRRISLRAGVPVRKNEPGTNASGTHGFLSALKLNPSVSLLHVRVLSPEEASSAAAHDASRNGPPGGMYVPLSEGDTISAREVLAAFSDEPDWGMDQDLYPIRDYGYGPAPFGRETGKSSQAPFHMAFLHESPILTAIIPSLRRSFMEERIRVFFALARAAFAHRVKYWGWRFTAWAMHYLQDLTQPYHARPFPVPLAPVLKRLVLNRDPRAIMLEATDYLKNRHILFEAIVHFMLNEVAKKSRDHPFVRALDGTGNTLEKPLLKFMYECSTIPSSIARTADRAMQNLVNASSLESVAIIGDQDAFHKIDLELLAPSSKRQELLSRFIHIVSKCLLETGSATRYAVKAATCGESGCSLYAI